MHEHFEASCRVACLVRWGIALLLREQHQLCTWAVHKGLEGVITKVLLVLARRQTPFIFPMSELHATQKTRSCHNIGGQLPVTYLYGETNRYVSSGCYFGNAL